MTIKGVRIKPLKKIVDERGYLMEIMRDDDDHFQQFGQMYLSVCNVGFVKGWHMHKIQTDNMVVVAGKARILLYDQREDSPTKGETMEIFSDTADNQVLVSIPPGIMHGWECDGEEALHVINCPTHHYVYDKPDEYRVDPFENDIPVKWNNKKGG